MAAPDDPTPTERVSAAGDTARSLRLLLEEIEREAITATPLQIARLRGALDALEAILGQRVELEADAEDR
jgi:hypothetical protein